MSFFMRKNVLFFYGLLFIILNECRAVKINSIDVPKIYELKKDAQPLILDCDFTVDKEDSGFVLKWKHNGVAVYQWIPSKKDPIGLGSFRNRIDTNYTSSDDRMKKHSALVISKPNVNDTGTYSCNVQSFQGKDEQSATVQIIDKEDSIDLTYVINADDTVDIKCEISKVNPLPKVTILIDNVDRKLNLIKLPIESGDAFDYVVSTQVKKSDLNDESTIACSMSIEHTDYTKKQEITFDDPKQSATTKKPILGELTIAQSEADVTNENHATGLKYSLSIVLLSFLVTLFH